MENNLKYLINVRDGLKSFAEEFKSQMSVNVYNGLWNEIQSIDHYLDALKE